MELCLALGIADKAEILKLSSRKLQEWDAFATVRQDRKQRLAEDGKTMMSWWD